MENSHIRRMARGAGVPLWKVAGYLGVSEPTLTRWLRFPLSEDKEKNIMSAITELEQEVDA